MIDVSFRVISVIDIQNGVVVHAQGGDRRGYKPFASSCVSENPDAVAVATSLRDRFGFREVYLADLDAIGSGRPSSAVLPRLLELEIKVIADLGIKDQVDFCSHGSTIGCRGRQFGWARHWPVERPDSPSTTDAC